MPDNVRDAKQHRAFAHRSACARPPTGLTAAVSLGKGGMGEVRNGLTYSEAGVDIDAGNAMVEAIKPLVRSTRRPGADAEIGGFGGLFDLKAAGFR
ncbi:MAG TPA: hypothetical protein VK434_15440, partial [Microvirga sp.]|nr:hypothetical protein [Microvirga sp.]